MSTITPPRHLILGAAFFLPLLSACTPKPLPPLHQSVYVWQQQWSNTVREALTTAAPAFDIIAVLAGRLDATDHVLQPTTIAVDWDAIKATGRPVLPVFRAHELPGLDTPEGKRKAAEALLVLYQRSNEAASAAGVTLAGMQLDYDCPTARLDAYAGLVAELKAKSPELPLSITALPDWLRSDEIARLVAPLEHYVLQVHALEAPKTIADPAIICDPARISGWVAQAGSLGHPFLVALPSYGYRLHFAEDGRFSGIAAEGAEAMAGARTRELHADPLAMATVVSALSAQRPKACRGLIWFRLPVVGDTLNWSWPVLAQVMQGKAPETKIIAEVRTPERHLFEVWVANQSGYAMDSEVRITLALDHATVLAQDGINHFRVERRQDRESIQILGPAPSSEQMLMAAWFRVEPFEEGTKPDPRVLECAPMPDDI